MDSSISAAVSLAAWAQRCARLRTSSATTANPMPASPARAASTAAFSARMLVWNAISSITLMILAILSLEALISPMATTISSSDWLVAANFCCDCVTRSAAPREFSAVLAGHGIDFLAGGGSLFERSRLLGGPLRQRLAGGGNLRQPRWPSVRRFRPVPGPGRAAGRLCRAPPTSPRRPPGTCRREQRQSSGRRPRIATSTPAPSPAPAKRQNTKSISCQWLCGIS